MGFDEFLARINNRRKRIGEYGKKSLAMQVDSIIVGVNRLD